MSHTNDNTDIPKKNTTIIGIFSAESFFKGKNATNAKAHKNYLNSKTQNSIMLGNKSGFIRADSVTSQQVDISYNL